MAQDEECRLLTVGPWYAMTGYAAAFPRNSKHFDSFNRKIMDYSENGERESDAVFSKYSSACGIRIFFLAPTNGRALQILCIFVKSRIGGGRQYSGSAWRSLHSKAERKGEPTNGLEEG